MVTSQRDVNPRQVNNLQLREGLLLLLLQERHPLPGGRISCWVFKSLSAYKTWLGTLISFITSLATLPPKNEQYWLRWVFKASLQLTWTDLNALLSLSFHWSCSFPDVHFYPSLCRFVTLTDCLFLSMTASILVPNTLLLLQLSRDLSILLFSIFLPSRVTFEKREVLITMFPDFIWRFKCFLLLFFDSFCSFLSRVSYFV